MVTKIADGAVPLAKELLTIIIMSTGGERKRRRDAADDISADPHPLEKAGFLRATSNNDLRRLTKVQKARPTFDEDFALWHPQDVSPSRSSHSQQHKYDSDDQSSMVSEPGSPQSISPDEDVDTYMMNSESDPPDLAHFLQSTDSLIGSNPLRPRDQARQYSPRSATSPLQTHMRQRHPQEYLSSDRLEVPSPTDLDEVPTPPSAAEAAGSQLELLTVSDVEMQTEHPLPRFTLQRERSPQPSSSTLRGLSYDLMNSETTEPTFVRKQRARSGALSEGNNSPMHQSRGISIGYREDCEKCRTQVPGHMNHFL